MFARAFRTAIVVGAVGFAGGFFGPMILDPSSGNGPLLGIFITGPGGFVLGLVLGVIREGVRAASHPAEVDRSGGPRR